MGENKSKLPFIIWPETEDEQKIALENSEQLAEFREYRKKIRNHPYTPYYHFCSPNGNLNDPNGICYYNGKYHMFYQQYPPIDPRQHWGHAVSEDLVHWEDLPTAIYPDPEYAVFSGNTLVEDDRVLAMYYGDKKIGNFIAESRDPLLLNWKKLTGKPVIPHRTDAPYWIFDPHLRREKDGYYSLSGINKHTHSGTRMTEYQFFSQDLVNWVYIGELMDENPFLAVDEDGACPYFIHMHDDRYLFLHFSHNTGPHMYSGIYNDISHKFRPDRHVKLSFDTPGNGTLNAPCAMSDGNGGAYCIFNCADGTMADSAYPRRGVMTMMYHITLDENDTPVISPLPQYDTLHDTLLCDSTFDAKLGERIEIPARGKALDIQMTVDLSRANGFEIELLSSQYEYTTVRFAERHSTWRDRAYVTIDSTHSSLDTHQMGKSPETISVPLTGEDRKLSIRILVDHCTVEVFCQGRIAFNMSYPTLSDSDRIFLSSLGGDIRAESVKIWNMKQIY
ncbi:MAG: glycoside hydrolase family 32 protein [Clostridia bacterium]|nr:glycoside hydrolase family 32 protein [Clostridia bacterium]